MLLQMENVLWILSEIISVSDKNLVAKYMLHFFRPLLCVDPKILAATSGLYASGITPQ